MEKLNIKFEALTKKMTGELKLLASYKYDEVGELGGYKANLEMLIKLAEEITKIEDDIKKEEEKLIREQERQQQQLQLQMREKKLAKKSKILN